MKEFMTRQEVAELLGVSNDTVRRWVREKRIEIFRAGNVVRISAESLRKFIEAERTASPEEEKQGRIFKNESHERAFDAIIRRMYPVDVYHETAAYLLALNPDLRRNQEAVFDFELDAIKPEALSESWQTGESLKCTRLLFNLWNGLHDDDGDGSGAELYTVESIFCGHDAAYYMEAVRIRFAIPFSPKGRKKADAVRKKK